MTEPFQPAGRPGAAVPTERNSRGVIPLLLLAAFVVILNETILAMALPQIMTSMNIQATTAQWLSTAFMLTMAVVIPVSGFLLQRVNTRPVFLTAMGLFSLGTLIAIVSPNFVLVLVARVIQASGTAVMMPLLMTTVLTLIPPHRRGLVMGNISIVISVAPAVGPTVSGLILQWLSWRWIFGIVLPLAVAMLIVGFFLLRNITEPRYIPIDLASVVLSAFGFGGLVYGLSEISNSADGPQVMIVAFAVGLVGLAAFVWRQIVLQRRDAPLLDLRTFRHRTFTLSVAAQMVAFGGMIGAVIILPIYLQDVRGMHTLTAGILLLPGGLIMGLMGPVVGRLYDRMNPRVLTVPGAILITLALFGLSRIDQHTPIGLLLGLHIALMLGLGLVFTPMFTAGLNALPASLYSHGSALLGALQQVGGAAGTAVLVTMLAIGTTAGARSGLDQLGALAHGVQVSLLTGSIMSLATLVLVLFVGKEEPADPAPDITTTEQQPALA